MAVFPSKKFQGAAELNTGAAKYRRAIAKHPFLAFGLPFLTIIVAGSFVLTPATAIRYEKHDRKVRQLSKEQELNVRKNPRRVDWRDEYQVRLSPIVWVRWASGAGRDSHGSDPFVYGSEANGMFTETESGQRSRRLAAEARGAAPRRARW